jgi:O-antigen/teichoic acid export membrane protein
MGMPVALLQEQTTFSVFQAAAVLLSTALLWGDTILLGLWRTPSESAIYTSATRLVWLGIIFYVPIGLAFQPLILAAREAGGGRLESITVTATKWIYLAAALPLLLLALSADEVLRVVYGATYTDGAMALSFLCVGQFIEAVTGPAALVILTAGYSRSSMIMSFVALTLDMALNVALIPEYGLTGAGLAWAISLAVLGVMRMVVLQRITDEHLATPRWLRPACTALVCAGGVSLLPRLLPLNSGLVILAAETAASATCYIWLLRRMRIGEL